MSRASAETGFSLVELLVALVILTVGILAMAAVTGFLILQVRVADTRTERSAAVQGVVEQVRALPFTSIESRDQASAVTVGSYSVWWDLRSATMIKRDLVFHSRGPGYVAGEGFTHEAVDSAAITFARMN